ncbi:drosomycin-like [Drosophila serrata]|uniref:drosomycin-like n=1 Tax=Drosophila serrata TaxID=7274 RepID=UPI000A1D0A14|nr:drosomycin-like [Drosophila serrata]KAH8385840.1 hypothetical protein KR200_009322 [Drosophila serrata]
MIQIKFLCLFLALMTIAVLDTNVAEARDCLSGTFKGPCWAWSGEKCRRLCIEEGHVSGHCSGGSKCWCEQC